MGGRPRCDAPIILQKAAVTVLHPLHGNFNRTITLNDYFLPVDDAQNDVFITRLLWQFNGLVVGIQNGNHTLRGCQKFNGNPKSDFSISIEGNGLLLVIQSVTIATEGDGFFSATLFGFPFVEQ